MTNPNLRPGGHATHEVCAAERGVPRWARILLVVLVVSGFGAFVKPALADTVGQTFIATHSCDGMDIQTGVSSGNAYTFPAAGTVSSWSTNAVSGGNEMEAVIWRPNGTDSFTLVGNSAPQVPTGGGTKTYPMNVAVEAGDVLAAWVETSDGVHDVAQTCNQFAGDTSDTSDWWRVSPPFPSSTPATGTCDGSNLCVDSGYRYDISASYTTATSAPDTSITVHPQGTTFATDATFAFASNEVSTFECALDSGAFAACTSPAMYSGLSAGTHTFAVRAISGGITDPSPATYTWTVESAGGASPTPAPSPPSSPAPPDQTTPSASGTFTANGDQPGSAGILGGADSVSWPGGAFPGVHTIQFGVASSPPLTGVAAGGVVLSLVFTDANGQRTTSFRLPLDLHIKSPGTGVTPAYFDGTAWHLIPLLASLPLPASQSDGYAINSDGSLDIYTHHATLFGALAHATGTTPNGFTFSYKPGATTFKFSWEPPAFGGVAGYRLVLGTKVLYQGKATFAIVQACTGTFALVVMYSGSAFVPADLLTIALRARPKPVPHQIPAWAYQLYRWERAGKKSGRPKTAPVKLPSWYVPWRTWRLTPYRVAPDG